MSRKFKFGYDVTKTTGTLQKDLHTFIITSRSFLFRMRNIIDKYYTENQNTNSIFTLFQK
jgi:hypothetical protein